MTKYLPECFEIQTLDVARRTLWPSYFIMSRNDKKLFHGGMRLSRLIVHQEGDGLIAESYSSMLPFNRFRGLASDVAISLGYPEEPGGNRQISTLTKPSGKHQGYSWQVTLADRTHYLTWEVVKLDRKDISAFKSPKLWIESLINQSNYRLRDTSTDEILATFSSQRNRRACGVLEAIQHEDKRFDLMLIITFLNVYRLDRRRLIRVLCEELDCSICSQRRSLF